MKTLNASLILILIIITAPVNVKAQEYCTLNYWGKKIPLDRSFFEILNEKYDSFKSNYTRRSEHEEYSNMYYNMIQDLKRPSFTIIVNEDNSLSSINKIYIQGLDGNTSKKSDERTNKLLFRVLLPSLKKFYEYKK